MLNNVCLVGRITRDLQLRTSVNGTPFVYFTVAVDESFSSQNGNRFTNFIPCVAWNKTAETMCKYLSKGALISVVGSIRTRRQSKPDEGASFAATVVEVNATNVRFLESRNSRSTNNNRSEPTFDSGSTPQNSNQDVDLNKIGGLSVDEALNLNNSSYQKQDSQNNNDDKSSSNEPTFANGDNEDGIIW